MGQSCLVVDDSRVVRKVARRILEGHGFAVREAEDGQQALDACDTVLPDCVLLDWNMPVMNGIEFLKVLRAKYGPDRPAVVFCTTETDMSYIEQAIEHGAQEFVMKPFDEEILIGKFAQAGLLLSLAARSLPEAPAMPAPVRVMVCDDSLAIRGAIVRMLESDPAIRVVARAANGKAAVDELARTPVDVVVLDIEMPVMDGIQALPLLLKADPQLRVIMASTLTTRGADIAMRALCLGAADYVPKPNSIGVAGDDHFRTELIEKVKGLARLRCHAADVADRVAVTTLGHTAAPPAAARTPAAAPRLQPPAMLPARLLAIGSSTGGPQALFTLVQGLGDTLSVPVVLTQHMPKTFTPILAEHISKLRGMPCAEARHGETLQPGRIYLAPGDRHLQVEHTAGGLQARLSDDPPENYCRPSVDPMLRSAAAACDGRVLVAMLTGMGHDGLAGTRRVIDAGGTAVAQDEATSVVWGMPGAVAQAGLCHAVLPLPEIAGKLRTLLGRGRP